MLLTDPTPSVYIHTTGMAHFRINVTFCSATLARTIWLPDDDPRTEICRSVFNVLMWKFYKFYICAVVGIIIEKL